MINQISRNAIPPVIAPLFHNYRVEAMDLQRDEEWIILTVLTGGSWEQIKWICAHYGLDRVEAAVRQDLNGLRTLPSVVGNFWSIVFWNRPLPPMSSKERWGVTRRLVPDSTPVEGRPNG